MTTLRVHDDELLTRDEIDRRIESVCRREWAEVQSEALELLFQAPYDARLHRLLALASAPGGDLASVRHHAFTAAHCGQDAQALSDVARALGSDPEELQEQYDGWLDDLDRQELEVDQLEPGVETHTLVLRWSEPRSEELEALLGALHDRWLFDPPHGECDLGAIQLRGHPGRLLKALEDLAPHVEDVRFLLRHPGSELCECWIVDGELYMRARVCPLGGIRDASDYLVGLQDSTGDAPLLHYLREIWGACFPLRMDAWTIEAQDDAWHRWRREHVLTAATSTLEMLGSLGRRAPHFEARLHYALGEVEEACRPLREAAAQNPYWLRPLVRLRHERGAHREVLRIAARPPIVESHVSFNPDRFEVAVSAARCGDEPSSRTYLRRFIAFHRDAYPGVVLRRADEALEAGGSAMARELFASLRSLPDYRARADAGIARCEEQSPYAQLCFSPESEQLQEMCGRLLASEDAPAGELCLASLALRRCDDPESRPRLVDAVAKGQARVEARFPGLDLEFRRGWLRSARLAPEASPSLQDLLADPASCLLEELVLVLPADADGIPPNLSGCIAGRTQPSTLRRIFLARAGPRSPEPWEGAIDSAGMGLPVLPWRAVRPPEPGEADAPELTVSQLSPSPTNGCGRACLVPAPGARSELASRWEALSDDLEALIHLDDTGTVFIERHPARAHAGVGDLRAAIEALAPWCQDCRFLVGRRSFLSEVTIDDGRVSWREHVTDTAEGEEVDELRFLEQLHASRPEDDALRRHLHRAHMRDLRSRADPDIRSLDEESFLVAVSFDTEDPDWYQLYGQFCLATGQHDEAREVFAIESSLRGTRRFQRALAEVLRGQRDEARRLLDAHLEEEPTDIYALWLAGSLGKQDAAGGFSSLVDEKRRTPWTIAYHMLTTAPGLAGSLAGWLREISRVRGSAEMAELLMEVAWTGHSLELLGLEEALSCLESAERCDPLGGRVAHIRQALRAGE